ncbi:BREX system Lon protease-like protein BrxL [Cetobacterium sp.]|uniref:BREX system Lon protease-like protein BrxL n=1 Tax=Cetobacterium sp. TaxID=2071632 RepID=UPI003EE524CA
MMNLESESNSKKIPHISYNFKRKNLDRFFYEYALYKGIDLKNLDISQKDLDIKINTIYQNFFKIEILDTISIMDQKEYLVKLENYNLGKYKIKISERIFSFFESEKYISGKITLEFDKTRNLFYITGFEKWTFDFSINNLFNDNLNFKDVLHSLGYDNQNLLFREKICILARLLPCVQKNINIIEITKPQVGKSYIYDELMTKNTIIKKLGDLTSANLFSSINSSNRDEAILKNYSILCIDEFHKGELKDIVAGLQTFMENGKVSRGKEYHSDTSIIMFANFKEKDVYKKIFINPEEFNPFKKIPYIDEAFLQRINYINPSFGMRTLNNNMFLKENVERIPVTLYQDLFNELRKIEIDFKEVFPDLKISINNTEIDKRASQSIFKTTSGFLKLLFPHIVNKIINKQNLREDILSIAICFYLSLEGHSILSALSNKDTTLKISVFDKIISLNDHTLYAELVKYFLDLKYINNDNITPHRYLELDCNNIINRIPLDTIGIEQNLNEINIYNNNNSYCIFNYYLDNNYIYFNKSLINFGFILLRNIYKNFLFGYSFSSYNIKFSLSHDFGNCITVNKQNILCPKCKKEFSLFWNSSNVSEVIDTFKCPICETDSFNYEFFPEFFKDFNE